MKKLALTSAQGLYLDLVRALAAGMVLLGHAGNFFLAGTFLDHSNLESLGVLIFFLLSGFLISYTVYQKFDTANYGFREFFLDRFSRIYSAYLPALLLVAGIDIFARTLPLPPYAPREEIAIQIANLHQNAGIIQWLGNLLMFHNYPVFQVLGRLFPDSALPAIRPYGSAAPFWTISVEWWLYLCFGVLSLLIVRRRHFSIPTLLALGFTAIVPFYYLIGGPLDCLAILWAIGSACALGFVTCPAWRTPYFSIATRRRQFLLAAILLGFGLTGMLGRIYAHKLDTGNFSFTELQFSVFLAVALFSPLLVLQHCQTGSTWLERLIRFFAGYSYSLYLIHMPVIMLVFLNFSDRPVMTNLFYGAVAASHLLAILFWFLFERHHRRLAHWLKSTRLLRTRIL